MRFSLALENFANSLYLQKPQYNARLGTCNKSTNSVVQATMPEFTEGEGLCATKKGSGAGDGGAAWGATSVLRVCVAQVCELCLGSMTGRS